MPRLLGPAGSAERNERAGVENPALNPIPEHLGEEGGDPIGHDRRPAVDDAVEQQNAVAPGDALGRAAFPLLQDVLLDRPAGSLGSFAFSFDVTLQEFLCELSYGNGGRGAGHAAELAGRRVLEVLAPVQAPRELGVSFVCLAQGSRRIVPDRKARDLAVSLVAEYEGLGPTRIDAQGEAPPRRVDQVIPLGRAFEARQEPVGKTVLRGLHAASLLGRSASPDPPISSCLKLHPVRVPELLGLLGTPCRFSNGHALLGAFGVQLCSELEGNRVIAPEPF